MFKVLSLAAAVLLIAGVAFGGVISSTLSTATSSGGCVLVCPGGDGSQMSAVGATITITVLNTGGVPIEGIPASDAWVIDCDPSGDMILCGGSGSSNADAASDASGVMTMSGDITAGGCADGVSVVVQGTAIGSPPTCLSTILIRSPDIDGDLNVALADFDLFGQHYNPKPYDKCCDYDCNASVVLADFSTFGLHYKHICH